MNIFAAIVVYNPKDWAQGFFFYNGKVAEENGRIVVLPNLTIQAVINYLKTKGIDAIKDTKLNIAVYHGVDIYGNLGKISL